MNVKTGDRIRLNGYSLEVVGVMPPGAHNPVLYDIRRMPGGAEYVAGVTIERDESLLQRPQRAVVIPLDIISDLNVNPNYCHIAFMDELSQAQREDIEELIAKTVDSCSFTDLSVYSEIDYINFIGKVVVSISAVFAGIINVVALFSFFIRENKKQYLTYKMHGATNLRIIALILLELAIYTLFSFSIGWMGPVRSFGIRDLSVCTCRLAPENLYCCISCSTALLPQYAGSRFRMRRVSMAGTENDARSVKREWKRQAHSEEGANSKFLYLLSFRYAKSRVAATISICFFIGGRIIYAFVCNDLYLRGIYL